MKLSEVHPFGAVVNIPGGVNVRTLAIALLVLRSRRLSVVLGVLVERGLRLGLAHDRPLARGLRHRQARSQAVLVGRWTKKWGERKASLMALFLNVLNFVFTGLATQSWMAFAVIVLASPAGVAIPAMNAWMSKSRRPTQGRLQGDDRRRRRARRSSAHDRDDADLRRLRTKVPGAPFFVAAALGRSILIAMRAAAPPATSSDDEGAVPESA